MIETEVKIKYNDSNGFEEIREHLKKMGAKSSETKTGGAKCQELLNQEKG